MLILMIFPSLEIASREDVMRFSLGSMLLYLTCSITSSHSALNALKSSFCVSETIFLPWAALPFTLHSVAPETAVFALIMSFCSARIFSSRLLYSSEFLKEYLGSYRPKD